MHSAKTKTLCASAAGMTLVEVIIALTIGTGILGIAGWFTVEGIRASYIALADVENGIQQWGVSTKLQIDGKVANGATIYLSADKALPLEYLEVVPVDDGSSANGFERGKVLVLTKSKLDQGRDTGVITDLIFYVYTPGSAPDLGTLKRYPATAPDTFAITEPLDPITKLPKSVDTLVDENIDTLLADAGLVLDHVISVASKGPFGRYGSGNHVTIALVREETAGKIKRSNLTEVSFNLR